MWVVAAPPAGGQPPDVTLRVIGWNLESGESDPDSLAKQIAGKAGVQLWGLSEVENQTALDKYVAGANKTGGAYKGILGSTGNADRLAIVYDENRLKPVGPPAELKLIQLGSGQRAPLVAKFKGELTGQEFVFVVNHLARGDKAKRHQQARLLNQWVQTQTVPVIAVGDYNFDWDVVGGDGGDRDEGYDELTRNGRFLWVRPERLVKTQASPQYNSVLDFVFVGNIPFGWSAESRILNREDDTEATPTSPFGDNATATDHRPVDAVFTFRPAGTAGGAALAAAPAGGVATAARQELRKEIEELRRRLQELEKKLESLDR
jgi:endonuclease/exonuclease/phosphatase family metal-dependent hydrolase